MERSPGELERTVPVPPQRKQGHRETREDKQESRRNRVAGVVTRINAGKKIWVEFRNLKRNE
jgi:hypothetical protein